MSNRKKDPNVSEVKHKFRIPIHDCDYEEFLLAGTKLIQYAIDAASELNIRREGQAGMLASVQANVLGAVYGLDMIEVVAKIAKVGNRSRTIDFEIYKIIERGFNAASGDIKNEVLDEPIKVVEGRTVLVLETQFM